MKVGTDGVLLGAWAKGGKRMLDIGSGTGLISLMMAQRFPLSLIDAIDVEIDCCIQAEENVNNSPFVDRIHVYRASLQDYTCENKMYFFDSIVSNPPYFVNSLKSPDSKRSMARHSDCLPFDVLLKCEFCFKKFSVCQDRCAMKVGTDGVLLGAWVKGGKRMLN